MNIHRLLTLLACLLALTGCGGGSPAPTATPQTCGFNFVYADGGTSGYAVSPLATSVPKPVTPCGITQVQSVTLGLCISPAQTNELKVQLLSSGSLAIPVSLVAATITASPPCQQYSGGTLYSVALPTSVVSNNLNDLWRLSVEDTVPGYTSSYFVGWSLEVKGLK